MSHRPHDEESAGQPVIPSSNFLYSELGEQILESLVGSLYLTIGLGMIGGRSNVLDLVRSGHRGDKLVDELFALVAGHSCWNSVAADDLFVEERSD